jgi:predicted anti-sigma-YlaC factor YlaD
MEERKLAMKCEEHQRWISMYVDGEIEDSAEVFAHLGECVSCRRFLRTLLEVREALLREERPRFPASFGRGRFSHAQKSPPILRGVRATVSRTIRVPALIAVLGTALLLANAAISIALWANRETERVPAVYMTRLPTVEVYAKSPSHPLNNE